MRHPETALAVDRALPALGLAVWLAAFYSLQHADTVRGEFVSRPLIALLWRDCLLHLI